MTPTEIADYKQDAYDLCCQHEQFFELRRLVDEQCEDMYDDLGPQDHFNQLWNDIQEYGGYCGDIDDLIDAACMEEDEYANA